MNRLTLVCGSIFLLSACDAEVEGVGDAVSSGEARGSLVGASPSDSCGLTPTPIQQSEIICELADAPTADEVPATIALRFERIVLESFPDGDEHARVSGTYEQAGGVPTTVGALEGEVTPKLWFGGSFDVSMDGVRLLILRSDPERAFVWFGDEASRYTCTGALPE